MMKIHKNLEKVSQILYNILNITAKEHSKMNNIKKQLEAMSKQIEKDSKINLSIEDLFSRDFMRSCRFGFTITELFDAANVDISNAANLSDEEKDKVFKSLPQNKFKSWDDFFKSAEKYQTIKQLKSKGYRFK